jgi:hypothetical protein
VGKSTAKKYYENPDFDLRQIFEGYEAILTPREVSKFLDVHPNSLRRWEIDGVVKAYRFDTRGHRRYKFNQILNLLQKPF